MTGDAQKKMQFDVILVRKSVHVSQSRCKSPPIDLDTVARAVQKHLSQ